MMRVALLALVFSAAIVSTAGAQQMHMAPVPAPSPFHIAIDASALAGLPRATITATDESGHSDTYAGVSLRDLLARNGLPAGMAVRGKAMTAAILVGASDGYRVIFALPELDPSYTDHIVLIADQKDGAPLPGNTGPYRLIVPFDKREARWVREVTSVDLVNIP